ncbi:hypothetical protein KPH14_001148 [Odynerus spinipes]|uniref:SCP domain-containing protein n=1 Tax=Odynerus spinipes TaxID=1348599 RepID=A0AAD9RQA4_9HYME|nr:hypothetical protein KPH14_001148 [Odynerus spinipes]
MMKICGLGYLVVIATIIGLSYGDTDYCQIKCPRSTQHTMCIYGKSTGPSSKCGVVKAAGPTAEEKSQILQEHNEFRQKVAKGLENRGKPGPQPPAKNMKTLEWDDELAKIAQRWANQCDFKHDRCRNVATSSVGQNLAMQSSSGDSFAPVKDLIRMWEDEVALFNPRNLNKLPSTGISQTGHYTQMVWAETNKVGCGTVKYNKDGWNTHYIVCNYSPSGNYLGESVYKV